MTVKHPPRKTQELREAITALVVARQKGNRDAKALVEDLLELVLEEKAAVVAMTDAELEDLRGALFQVRA